MGIVLTFIDMLNTVDSSICFPKDEFCAQALVDDRGLLFKYTTLKETVD